MKYELRANASLGSEWLVDEEGNLERLIMGSDCHQLDNYYIVQFDDNDDNEETIFDSESFNEAKKELERLTTIDTNIPL